MAHPLISKVKEIVSSKPVVIFMKGAPGSPLCGFSAQACLVLNSAGVTDLGSFDVLSDDTVLAALKEHTQWPTVPQIFIHGQFIGGCDILSEMHEKGELKKLLEK
jgi:monothiol glutaredoxin